MDSLRIWPDDRVAETLARADGTPSENDVNDLVAEVFRLRDVLTQEAKARGKWAGEAARLLALVEARERLRAQALAAEREVCAKMADEAGDQAEHDAGIATAREPFDALAARMRARP